MAKDQLALIRKKYGGKTFICRRASLFDHAPAKLRIYFGASDELQGDLAANWTDELQYLGSLDENVEWVKGKPVPIGQVASDGEPEATGNCFAFLFYDPKDKKRPYIITTSDEWSGTRRLTDLSELRLVTEDEKEPGTKVAAKKAPAITPAKVEIPPGVEAAGMYVFCGSAADASMQATVIREVKSRWKMAKEMPKVDARGVRTDIGLDKRLAYAVSKPKNGWLLVIDSSGECADFSLAKKLNKKLGAEVIWWVVAASCRDGAVRRIGTDKRSVEGYQKAGQYLMSLPFGYSDYAAIAKPPLSADFEFFCLDDIDADDYDFGPSP